ncbi:CGNR zinc finger domain-containing protein [Amycolatopsis sp. NPDC052450]|uniref:CGNR zinc finger domain-containing protein n=1 Tax=Amycolatopsis sp. NPDC052450 TaxID=3363937 RepID=UPI0037CC7616
MFTFLGGSPCLDLTATLEMRHLRKPRELLTTPGDVTSWLDQAGLVAEVAVDEAGLRRTVALREVVDRLCRGTGSADDLAALNATAAAPPLMPYWSGAAVENRGTLEQALSTLARDAIALLSGPRATRIRECAHPECSRLFRDVSHSGRRRWCGMNTCGTKVKAAGYRRRKRARAKEPEQAELR